MKIKTRLTAQRKDLEKQLKEVEKNYPLVALAFYLHEATAIDSATHAFSQAVSVSFPSVQTSEVAERIAVRLGECIRKFDRDVGRAKTDEETIAAIKNLGECFRNAPRSSGKIPG